MAILFTICFVLFGGLVCFGLIIIPVFAAFVYLWEAFDKKFLRPRRQAKAMQKAKNRHNQNIK